MGPGTRVVDDRRESPAANALRDLAVREQRMMANGPQDRVTDCLFDRSGSVRPWTRFIHKRTFSDDRYLQHRNRRISLPWEDRQSQYE